MGDFGKVPQFPRIVAGTAPIDDATFGALGSSSPQGKGGKGGSGGLAGDEESDLEEPSMAALMKLMKRMDGKFDSIQVQFSAFRAELQALKAEMVTKQSFHVLEVRVDKLEKLVSEGGGLGGAQMNSL